MIKGLIFDLDGVLVDTKDLHFLALNEALKKCKVKHVVSYDDHVNIYDGFTSSQKNSITYILFLGTLLFSGSIYAINLTSITAKSIWFVTPLGGVTLIIGWFTMIVIFLNKLRRSK